MLRGLAAFFSRLRGGDGRRGERAAARYLRAQGLRIIARNWRSRGGEIDLIALEGELVVFVEVKSRATAAPRGDPLERIGPQKLARIRRAAQAFRSRARGLAAGYRLDAVVVEFAPPGAGASRAAPSVRWYRGLHEIDH